MLGAPGDFLTDEKVTKESPGDGSGEHRVVLLVARPPDPHLRGLPLEVGKTFPARKI